MGYRSLKRSNLRYCSHSLLMNFGGAGDKAGTSPNGIVNASSRGDLYPNADTSATILRTFSHVGAYISQSSARDSFEVAVT